MQGIEKTTILAGSISRKITPWEVFGVNSDKEFILLNTYFTKRVSVEEVIDFWNIHGRYRTNVRGQENAEFLKLVNGFLATRNLEIEGHRVSFNPFFYFYHKI